MKLFRAFTIGAVAARTTKKEAGGVTQTKAKLGADILYTPNHLAYLEEHGIDTSNYRVDDSLPLLPVEKGANNDLPWKAVWTNPEGFDESHLRIPFRFQPNAFTTEQENDIVSWLDELSGYLDGCIEFFHDIDEIYPKDYIYVRSINDDGTATLGECWSYVGQITKFYNMDSQDLNLSPPNPEAGYWGHCVWKSVVQHEFMHALGFDHEQNRPDRDDYIDVHYENVIPELAYNYDKMTDLSWDDQGEEYDLKSVMHYDGDAFITTEAWLKGLSTMTYKGTDERVIVWAERADSIDTVQIAKRYKNTCPIPATKMCADGKRYYLEGRDCDGVADCLDKSDEPIATCQDLGCGKVMYATSSYFLDYFEQSTLTFYFVEGEYINDKPQYYDPASRLYLYYYEEYGSWHINDRPGSEYAWYYGYPDPAYPCPTGKDESWWGFINNEWVQMEDFRIYAA